MYMSSHNLRRYYALIFIETIYQFMLYILCTNIFKDFHTKLYIFLKKSNVQTRVFGAYFIIFIARILVDELVK